MSKNISTEVARRRTFAIISHPDAGKTTLTEKLLYFAGAIHIAGSVKSRKAQRHAASDWMEIEQQRGISVASSVMQMEYRDCVINLLDTAGHEDFSEDTYRVLTAVDAALMVIDAANGIVPQTERLLSVCLERNTHIITFINKLDREAQLAFNLIEEIESYLGMETIPINWPIGMGRNFKGIYSLKKDEMQVYEAGKNHREKKNETLPGLNNQQSIERFGQEFTEAAEEVELIQAAIADFDKKAFLNAKQTPVFFGSALNNFGIQEILDALVDWAPPPGPRNALQRKVAPTEEKFTGMVFKVQANMDPAHRDRVAFVRVSSGYFNRGMRLHIARTGRELRPNNVVTFLSQRRERLDEAYAGDIIGIPNHGLLQLGDVLTEGETLQFTCLPFFAPELFQAVEVNDPLRVKQLRTGLTQLGDEGAIQVFRPHLSSGTMLLGEIGRLQFEVVAQRLKNEYAVDARFTPSRYEMARWVTSDDPDALQRFIDQQVAHMAYDVVDAVAFLATSPAQLRVAQELHPAIEFHSLREHGGQIFGS